MAAALRGVACSSGNRARPGGAGRQINRRSAFRACLARSAGWCSQ